MFSRMIDRVAESSSDRSGDRSARSAFSLVELLTVMFIISLLIAILIPSLHAARNAAKKTTTAATVNALKVGLDLFKNDNENDFRQTNGYPPSFSHPKIGTYSFLAEQGEFPFLTNKPKITGAQWLPAMLVGVDSLGYISRNSVPNVNNLPNEPDRWYTQNPLGTAGRILERQQTYMDPTSLKLVRAFDLPGTPNGGLFDGWPAPGAQPDSSDDVFTVPEMPVITDSFGQAILYYASNAFGKMPNLVDVIHPVNNNFGNRNPPFYFHIDNAPFTGVDGAADDESKFGWRFRGRSAVRPHPIAVSGHSEQVNTNAMNIETYENGKSFAYYILDRAALRAVPVKSRVATTPMRPVNADSYLLISAGADGSYGTSDDVNNLPAFASN